MWRHFGWIVRKINKWKMATNLALFSLSSFCCLSQCLFQSLTRLSHMTIYSFTMLIYLAYVLTPLNNPQSWNKDNATQSKWRNFTNWKSLKWGWWFQNAFSSKFSFSFKTNCACDLTNILQMFENIIIISLSLFSFGMKKFTNPLCGDTSRRGLGSEYNNIDPP